MLDLDRIKIFTKRGKKGIRVCFKYKFPDGREEKYTLFSLSNDGMTQTANFGVFESAELALEGFNFKTLRHPRASQEIFQIMDMESLPMGFGDVIKDAMERKQGGHSYKLMQEARKEWKKVQSTKDSADTFIEMLKEMTKNLTTNQEEE